MVHTVSIHTKGKHLKVMFYMVNLYMLQKHVKNYFSMVKLSKCVLKTHVQKCHSENTYLQNQISKSV